VTQRIVGALLAAPVHTQMSEKKQIRAIKGVRDILPPESALWNRVEQTAHAVFATYDFGEIRLPVLEETELFARSIGAETDVVSKEMYTFHDRPAEMPTRKEIAASFANYARKLLSFYDRSEIPQSATNKALIPSLRSKLKEFDDAYAELEVTNKKGFGMDSGLQHYKDIFSELGALTNSIELGISMSLRPEATASVCRAYIAHGMHTWPQPVKLYYLGPMFRRERPQKGRYRQFYQIGAEVLGQSDAPAIDAEVIEMLVAFFDRVGLTGTTLYVNSIGCKDCRPAYVQKLKRALEEAKDKLGADSQRRIETNPLRVLDSKIPEEQPIIEKLPRIADHLCDACRTHFSQLQEQLKLRGIAYEINWRLVRGLDYYMRTTFEITAPGLGSQNAVCGGGRYDGLVELLGGPPTKGIGFAIGTDRLVLSLQESGKGDAKQSLDAFIAWMGPASYPTALKLARRLREEGFSVELPAEEMKFKKSLGLADKLGARYAVIIGEDEVASGQFTLKRLADAEQKKLSEAELIEALRTP
jgi:histidyl-tRNA synthetase